MTKDEALRLALEYVELVPDDRYNADHIDQDALITAIKAALEAKDEPVVWNGGVPAMLPKQKEGETFIVSYEPKLEAKDEPVAFKIYKPTPPRGAIPNVRDAELPWVYDQDPSSGNVASMWVTPVKATPPQRKPLTDEELRNHYQSNEWLDGVRFAEQFHGIKGEA